MSHFKPVLFITLPNVTLFMKKKKDALALSLGASFVTAGIQKAGLSLDYFDFNLALNQLRQEIITPEDTRNRITVPSSFIEFYYKGSDSLLESWVDLLCSMIPQRDYSVICFSLDRREFSSFSNKGSYCFSVLLARELKKRFSAPIIMGGKYTFESLGSSFTESIRAGIENFPIDGQFKGAVLLKLGEVLRAHQEGHSILSPETKTILEQFEDFRNAAGLVPNYNIVNRSDLLVERENYIPDHIIENLPDRFRKLKDLDPFFVAPYKFTVGCPYTCAFCADGLDMKYTQHRAEHIVNVLSALSAQGITDFNFYNNNINLNRDFLTGFHSLMNQANLKLRFSDSANLQNANDDFFGRLAQMGCVRLWYGTESVSERQLKIIHKNLNREKIESGLISASKHGIWNSCNFIFNFPHERAEEFDDLVQFITTSTLVDTFETNEFRLVDDTAYEKFPERFGISLKIQSESGKIHAYDEIGGLSWNEKVELGQAKRDVIRKIKTPMYRYMTCNDYIVFGMRRAGFDKQSIKELIVAYSDHLYAHSIRRKFDEDHLHTLPSYIFNTRPKGMIYGHEIAPLDANFAGTV